MAKPPPPVTSPRKLPVQKRSTELVAAILQAAIRVLERDGAQRFTTVRVAEQAGVSVGSLYQYFPNKQAILFRLQLDEWQATGATLDALLGDGALPVADRLRNTIRAFFHSECDEAPLRLALDAAAPIYRDAPESHAQRRRSGGIVRAFVAEAAPSAPAPARRLAAELIKATMGALGEQVSARRPPRAEVDRWADAVADMLLAYLAQLAPRRPRRRAGVVRGRDADGAMRTARTAVTGGRSR